MAPRIVDPKLPLRNLHQVVSPSARAGAVGQRHAVVARLARVARVGRRDGPVHRAPMKVPPGGRTRAAPDISTRDSFPSTGKGCTTVPLRSGGPGEQATACKPACAVANGPRSTGRQARATARQRRHGTAPGSATRASNVCHRIEFPLPAKSCYPARPWHRRSRRVPMPRRSSGYHSPWHCVK